MRRLACEGLRGIRLPRFGVARPLGLENHPVNSAPCRGDPTARARKFAEGAQELTHFQIHSQNHCVAHSVSPFRPETFSLGCTGLDVISSGSLSGYHVDRLREGKFSGYSEMLFFYFLKKTVDA
jgi:hypothetical protein